MSECGSNIVECLREKGVNPSAYSSSWNPSFKGYADNALIYSTSQIFHTINMNEQWWKVDFKRIVTIHTYQIQSASCCDNIRKWTVSISNNNNTWKVIDSPPENGYPSGRNYTLKKIYSARYFKINKLETTTCAETAFAFYYVKFFGSISGIAFPRGYSKCSHFSNRYYIQTILFPCSC